MIVSILFALSLAFFTGIWGLFLGWRTGKALGLRLGYFTAVKDLRGWMKAHRLLSFINQAEQEGKL